MENEALKSFDPKSVADELLKLIDFDLHVDITVYEQYRRYLNNCQSKKY